jgi:hypothetical protein
LPNLLTVQVRPERGAVEEFLRPARLDRSGAVKFERAPGRVEQQISAEQAEFRVLDDGQKTKAGRVVG